MSNKENTPDKKFKVTYDHYGSNRDVPLYTKSHNVRAVDEKGAIDIIKKLVGGRNHAATLINESFLSFKEWVIHMHESKMIHMKDAQGLADKHGVPLAQIIDQISKGTKVEREHTDDDSVATKIAIDHIKEMPNYYTKLQKMESGKC